MSRFAHLNKRCGGSKALSIGDQPVNPSPTLDDIGDQLGGGVGIGRVDRPSQIVDAEARQLSACRIDRDLSASSHHDTGTAAT